MAPSRPGRGAAGSKRRPASAPGAPSRPAMRAGTAPGFAERFAGNVLAAVRAAYETDAAIARQHGRALPSATEMVPKMKAVAVARAVGGDIEKGDARYVAEMMPAKSVMTIGGYIHDSMAPGMLQIRKVTH